MDIKKQPTLWAEKYRPDNINNYVFKNPAFKNKMLEWIETGEIPHIGLFGPAGTGKTSAINVLLHSLYDKGFVDESDVTILNMSDEGMEAVRDKIDAVARLQPCGRYRVFVLEEMEQMSAKSQGSLKRIMEDYYENARFILTSNDPQRIVAPIKSRLQTIILEKHDHDEFTTHILEILIKENVELDTEESIALVDEYIKISYPDFRKTLNTLQSSVVNGKLLKLEDTIDSTATYKAEIIKAWENKTFRQMREIIVHHIPDDEIDNFFSYLYRNANIFTDDEIKLLKIKVRIRDAAVKGSTVADREMNLSALLCEIDLICAGEL